MSRADSTHLAYVADAIDRTGGAPAEFGYDETADMAAAMLQRFPAVRRCAACYALGHVPSSDLDSAVLDALAAF
jgi:hypothetical protein